MDAQLFRQLGLEADLDREAGGGSVPAGKSTLTSRLAPAPQVIFRVSDPATAQVFADAMSGGARVQRAAVRDDNGVAAGAEAAVERAASSSGSPLPMALQRQFEGSLGADLSGVRVHTGSESEAAAHAVGAKAYTVGNDIHFGAGKYQPADPFGMHLLAHEVAHTVQQVGATPGRQHKLEVSNPNDAAEHEADHAAEAMVLGRPTQVSRVSALSRVAIARDVTPVEISAGDMPYMSEDIADEQSQRVKQKSAQYTWGSGSITSTDENGKVSDNDSNPVVANAKKNGTMVALRAMSTELDVLKPAIMAWQASDAAVLAIAGSTGIDPDSPGKYAKEFKDLHDKMGNTKDPVIKEIKDRLNNARQSKVKQAAATVKGALAKVRGCEQRVQARKAELEAAKLGLDKDKNAAELAKINEAIQGCVKSITYIGKAAAAIAGGIGAIEAMGASSVGMASVADEAAAANGSGAISVPMNPYMPSSVKSGGEAVGGAGDMLTKFFEMTLFKEDIAKCKAEEGKINAGIAAAVAVSKQATTLAISSDLDEAMAKLDAAKIEVNEAKETYMTNLLAAGRAWDQRDKSQAQIDKLPKSALPGKKGETSMEGLMGMFGAMTSRGSARDAFKEASARCPTLNKGGTHVNQILDSGKATANQDAPLGATLPIDSPEYAQGVQGAVNRLSADNLRDAVRFVLLHMQHLTQNGAKEAGVEAGWATAVKSATVGNI